MKNEAGNVETLLTGIQNAGIGVPFEAVLVDDGSTDETASRITALQSRFPWLHLVQHERSGGQSAAIHSGVQHARHDWIITLDGDGQNPPAEIPKLLAAMDPARETLGLIAGQRARRRDSLSKRLASRFANGLRARLLNDKTRDTGCGLKVFRRQAFLDLPYFNHMHRYLPALFAAHGWDIIHVDVDHAPRHAGVSKYNNLQRGFVGLFDLFGVMWLIRRKKNTVVK